MTFRRAHSLAHTAVLLAAFSFALPIPSLAQSPKPAPPGKMAEHHDGMAGMMGGPHHALAMAYRDNLTTFAHALQGDVARSHAVALELARPATAEMRRSLDQMIEHHRGAMAAGGMSSNSAMTAKMKDMDTHISALREHMSALEAEVATNTPRAAMVTTHTTAILKECAGMPMMPATAKPHQMK